ncbi:MAG TPA: amidohydrolase [Clostridia bacterium]|nr:amidohydrolase [Clostridia bacterium]
MGETGPEKKANSRGKTTVLTAKWVLPSVKEGLKEDWAVAIEGGKISEVGPKERVLGRYGAKEATVEDLGERLIVPGFVNTHNHMYGVLSHGITVPVSPTGFMSFLEDFWWPYVEDRLNHDLVKTTTALACSEMIKSGVTAFSDILEAPYAIPGALIAEAEVVESAGLRGILAFEATERAGEKIATLGIEENEGFIRWSRERPSGLLGGMMCVHTTFTCSPSYLRRSKERAQLLGAMSEMHLSESKFEPEICKSRYGKLPVELYQEIGFLDGDVLASQCVKVTDEEIDTLAEAGVKISHMPLSNCEVGGGIAPVVSMLERGLTVGIGTDGYITDFFQVMRGAFLIHKAAQESPQVMPARTVFDMATRQGALAMGLKDVGVLAPGYRADLVALKTDLPTPITQENVYDQIVLFLGPQDVDLVMVEGNVLARGGRLLTLDEEGIKAKMREAARRFWKF